MRNFCSTHILRNGAETEEWVFSLFYIRLESLDNLLDGRLILIVTKLAEVV